MDTAPQETDRTQVLLIEDDLVQIDFITTLLSRERRDHFAVETSHRLSVAQKRLETGGIDVILLDLGLPDSQGIETVRMVHECAHSIPIIVLTGADDEDLALETLRNGAEDYLAKTGVDGPALARAIRYAIQRRRSDRELNEQRRRLHLLMECIPDLRIYFKDEGGCFIDVNPALARVYGFSSPQNLIGKTDFDLFSREHAEAARKDEQMIIRTGQTIAGKVERETITDGTTRWALTTKIPLRGEDGQIIGTCGISRDITGLKQAEEQLRQTNETLSNAFRELLKLHEELKATQLQLIQAEKLQSLGQMAAGVAHEIKNPLAILHMGIEYLGEYLLGRDEQIHAVISELKDAVSRANVIVREMLDYSAAAELVLEQVALDSLISKALRFVRHELAKAKINVVTQFAGGLPAFPLDASKMQQVLINVFVNACHAMPAGGTLTISTAQKVLEADEPEGARSGVKDVAFHKGERLAVLEIRDTGTGIPEDTLRHIFDSFVTTKARGTGTGLGLSVVRQIIELHGGRINIANAPEGGACVTIWLKSAP
jgi:PAS domain S-box-containing protein